MICNVCQKERAFTYRNVSLGVRSICSRCIRQLYPETLVEGIGKEWPREA